VRPGPRIIHQVSLLRLTVYPGYSFHVSEAGALARDGSGRVDLRAHGLRQPCLSRQLRLTGLLRSTPTGFAKTQATWQSDRRFDDRISLPTVERTAPDLACVFAGGYSVN
jgi:hypothetical protein